MSAALRLTIVVLCALAFNPVSSFVVTRASLRSFKIDGHSMNPALESDDLLVLAKSGGWIPFGDPGRGDIIAFTDPRHPDQEVVKRVIGLPGETIEISDGKVIINNEPLVEAYITRVWHDSKAKQPIPVGAYFVMGDNRDNSLDSRGFGPVPKDLIIGKVELTYWPSGRLGFAHNPDALAIGVLVFLSLSAVAAIGMLIAAWFILRRRGRSRWWTLLAWPLGGVGLLVIYLWIRRVPALAQSPPMGV